jgi:hypothetical protein
VVLELRVKVTMVGVEKCKHLVLVVVAVVVLVL